MNEQREGDGRATVVGSGATAGRDVILTGTYVAGRDLHIGEVHVHEAASPWTEPAQLPRDIDDFTGREDVLAEAATLLEAGIATPLLAVFGKPGVGKTALRHPARPPAQRPVPRRPALRQPPRCRGGAARTWRSPRRLPGGGGCAASIGARQPGGA